MLIPTSTTVTLGGGCIPTASLPTSVIHPALTPATTHTTPPRTGGRSGAGVSRIPTPSRSNALFGFPSPLHTRPPSSIQHDFNSFATESMTSGTYSHTPILCPLDKFLSPALIPLSDVPSALILLRSYGFAPPRSLPSGSAITTDRISDLMDLLLLTRSAQVQISDLGRYDRADILALCGIDVPDETDSSAVQAAAHRLTEYWLPSYTSIATTPEAAWGSFTKDRIRASLGILGYPVTLSLPKAELLRLVPIALRLAVFQGRLIPAMVQPFYSFTLPEPALLEKASSALLLALASATLDPNQTPPTDRKAAMAVIFAFSGPTIDGSTFDHSIWTILKDPIDRRLYLHCFGIPFVLTSGLSATDLLTLIPRSLPIDVPFLRSTSAMSRSRPSLRAAMAAVSSVAASPCILDLTNGGNDQLTLPPPLPPSITPTGPNPLLGSTFWSSPASTFTSVPSTVPLSGFGGSRELPVLHPPARSLDPMFAPVPPVSPGNAPTRIVLDIDRSQYELTLNDLAQFSTAALRRFAARPLHCSPDDVPPYTTEQLLAYIWQENTMAGFQFLLASSPTILLQQARLGFETRIWPTTTASIVLFYQGPAGVCEATYSVPSGPHGLTAVPIRRLSGNPSYFPDQGLLSVGTNVLVPPFPGSISSSSFAVPSLDPATQSHQHVADTFSKATRKASEGTRILSDILPDAAALQVFSADPTAAGRQSLYNVLYTFMSTTPIQCSLHTLVTLARGLVNLDPCYFIPLADIMDDNAAKHATRPLLSHRSEQRFPGAIVPLWNNEPARLRQALTTLFLLWGKIFLPDSTVLAALAEVASKIFNIARALPHWSVTNNSYFWTLVIEQVGDVFAAVGRTCTTPADLVHRLGSIPDFIHDERAKISLIMLQTTAEKLVRNNKASRQVIANTTWIDPAGAAPQPLAPPDATSTPNNRRPNNPPRPRNTRRRPGPGPPILPDPANT